MSKILVSIAAASLLPLLVACGGGGAGAGGGGAGGSAPDNCTLVDDSGGPGQYADTCVSRAWIEPYVGTYTSPTCELTITTPSGGPAAVFELVVSGATLAGTYTHDWGGGTGLGNDSYYRFTTDTTFATTKAENFSAGEKVSDTEERTIRLRVNDLDTGAPTFTGGFGETITSPFSNEEVDCGALTKQP
jgi:hypothetical protein